MELRTLKYFLAVAREENITKAAEFANTTQPNLSRQMKSLEEEIGRPLFVRGSRKITLTESGAILKKRAEEILYLYDKTNNELYDKNENIIADIHIGCGESYAVKLIAKAAKLVREEHPGIQFHLLSGDSEIVTERLDKGLLDFGVLINYSDMTPYDYLRLPLTDVWGVLMRKECPLAKKEFITLEDLREKPLIFSQQAQKKKSALTNWFQQSESLNIVATYNLIYNASLLVEEGYGYAITIDKLINTEGVNLCFRPLSPIIESNLDVVWKKYQHLPLAAEIFLNKLKEVIMNNKNFI